MKEGLLRARYFSGLSGIVLPIPKYQFPPEYQNSSRLTFYSTKFNSIEVNSSFYAIPMPSTVTRWVASVPDHFRFTFKIFREITHAAGLKFNAASVRRFLDAVAGAGDQKACILIQLPPSTDFRHLEQLAELLQTLTSMANEQGWRLAVEFRNKSWYHDRAFDLLAHHNVSLVIHDIPKSAAPMILTARDFVYMRFHGPKGNYEGSYSDAFLAEYASYVREWVDAGKQVFVYFNNTKGDAYNNLVSFDRLVTGT